MEKVARLGGWHHLDLCVVSLGNFGAGPPKPLRSILGGTLVWGQCRRLVLPHSLLEMCEDLRNKN